MLFTVTATSGGIDAARVAVLDRASGTWKTLPGIQSGSQAQYLPTGHLVYVAGGALWGVPFDLARLEVTGTARVVVPQVVVLPTETAEFDVATDGTLVFVASDAWTTKRTLVWVDRRGQEEAIPIDARPYAAARLSPDGTQVAVEREDQDRDIWVWHLARKTLTRVTTDPAADQWPVWMPDGQRLLFTSQRGGGLGSIFWQKADGSGPAERLIDSSNVRRVSAVLADGSGALFSEMANIKQLSLNGDRHVRPLTQTQPLSWHITAWSREMGGGWPMQAAWTGGERRISSCRRFRIQATAESRCPPPVVPNPGGPGAAGSSFIWRRMERS